MEEQTKRKILTNEHNLAYFSDLFEPTYRKFRLIRSNGERRKIRIHNLKMHRKYVRYLDYLKARNPSLHWLSTTKIRTLEDRMKNVFNYYDNRYPEEIIDIWKTGKMPFVLLSKRREKVIFDVKVCKLYTNRTDADTQARKLLLDGMVVRTETLLDGNFEYYKDDTITGEEYKDIPILSNELRTTISCNLFHYYYAKHDPGEYDEGISDYDISYLKEIEQIVDGEEKIRDIRDEIDSAQQELDTWKRVKLKITTYKPPKITPYIWKGEVIIRNLQRSSVNTKTTNGDEIRKIMSQSIICGERNPIVSSNMELYISDIRDTTDPTLSTALSITKHIDLHASRRYVIVARKGSGKTSKKETLSQFFEVVDSDLYGIWLRNFLIKHNMLIKPSLLKDKMVEISDIAVNESISRYYEYSKRGSNSLYEENVSIFRDLSDALLQHKESKDGPLTDETFEDIVPEYTVSLANMINQYLGLPKIGIGNFVEVISAIKDSTKPLLIFMHSTEESGFLRTPDFTFSMPDVFDTEEIIRSRVRGNDNVSDENNYGELLLYYTYLAQTSTIQPFIPFPVLLSWINRIGSEMITIVPDE